MFLFYRWTLLPKTEVAAVILPMEVRWFLVRFNCIHLFRMHVMLIVRVAAHTNVCDESKNVLTCLGEMKMQFNAEIMEREKMKAFFRMPDEALYHKIIICTYENVPAVAVVFYKKSTKEPFTFRIAPADYFSAEELIEIFKIYEFRGGEMRDDWYDVFSKWLDQL